MDANQMSAYESLKTAQARAKYLLDIGVTAAIDIDELDLVYRACVGDVRLPITACSKEVAIAKATDWLKRKADGQEEGGQ